MMIIARIPDGDCYLLGPDSVPEEEVPPVNTPARVLDTAEGVLYEARAFRMIGKHNPHYERYDGSGDNLDELLEGVEVRGAPIGEFSELPQKI